MFLLVYQLFTMLLTGYTSLHQLRHRPPRRQGRRDLRPPGSARSSPSPTRPTTRSCPSRRAARCSMLVTFPEGTDQAGQTFIGTPESLTPVPPDQLQTTGEKVTGVTGLPVAEPGHADRTTRTSPPSGASCASRSTMPPEPSCKSSSIFEAKESKSGFVYDEATDTMTDTNTGVVYTPNATSATSPRRTGKILEPGWIVWRRASANYTSLLTDPTIRDNFFPITIWTFVFAFLTVLHDLRAGPAAGHRHERPADEGPEVLPGPADPALRAADLPDRDPVEGHAQRRLRHHQPDPARATPTGWADPCWPASPCCS